ncbi:hypothetical protein AB0K60_13970 [Thermopolyspora sp. NPDC052614]|uniref:hypothetical protein n=1 Tax=Thermopolyspora sp. NPDC052614 TaxID=3155682 RepID=UPI003431A17B
MPRNLALELADVDVERLVPHDAASAASLESLTIGHGMTETAASILPVGCCSCCLCCCCCCS